MSKIEIKTTQNILLFFEPASVGERMGARLIDSLIIGGYGSIVYQALSYIVPYLSDDSFAQEALFLIFFLPSFFYPMVAEMAMQGQTFGKKIMKIRVIKIDGYQASFTDFLIRGLFGLLEIDLFSGSIAMISIIASKHSQRLGDFAAGTAVITERNKMNISHTILEELSYTYQPLFTKTEVLLFSDNDVQTIKNYFNEGVKKNNQPLLNRLSDKITQISKREPTPDMKISDFIQQFLKDYNYYTGY